MFFVGIDLGTSAVKLILMEEGGEIERTVSKEYPLYFPKPGWSEQNPQDWYEKTTEGMKELLEGVDGSRVGGIGVSGQMHGLVILDANDRVIRPAILWNDGRTKKECAYLNEVVGTKTLSGYTANIAFTGFTAPKLLWLLRNEPGNFTKIRKIMLPKDYLVYRLTGVHCTDASDASGTLLMDVKKRCWSKGMLKLCHIAKEQLPQIYESYEKVGTLLPQMAQEMGLSSDCVVAAGAGDNAAAAVGTGTVGEEMCNLSLGTSGTVFISSNHFCVDRNNALHAFAHADGKYHLMGCMLSAASCHKWWMEEILGTGEFAREQEGILRLGENHVFFLPYLMGERSPHNNPKARGTFIGMTMDTTRTDMSQAVLEGVAFALRDSLEVARSLGIQISRSKICGGGAKSPLWRQMIANVLNLALEVPETQEGPAMGAAMLAAVAAGRYGSVAEAAWHIVRVKECVEPNPELVQKYEEKYRIFQSIYPACKSIFDRMD